MLDYILCSKQTISGEYYQNLMKTLIIQPSKIGFDPSDQSALRNSMKSLVKTYLPPEVKLQLFEEKAKQILMELKTNKKIELNVEVLDGLIYLHDNMTVERKSRSELVSEDLWQVILASKDECPQEAVNHLLRLILKILSNEDVLEVTKNYPVIFKDFEDVFFERFTSIEPGPVTNAISFPNLVRFVRFISNNATDKSKSSQTINYVVSSWNDLIDNSMPKSTILLMKNLAIIDVKKVSQSEKIRNWYFKNLESQATSIKVKICLLDVLHIFVDDNDQVQTSLGKSTARGGSASEKVPGLGGYYDLVYVFIAFLGRFGKMTHLVNLKKCRVQAPAAQACASPLSTAVLIALSSSYITFFQNS